MPPIIWYCRGRKIKVRNKMILLAVFLSCFSVGLLMLLQKPSKFQWLKIIQKPMNAASFGYHTHNLTYLEELNDAKVNMSDPLLITAIREKFLRPPAPRSAPYKLKDPDLKSTSLKQAEAIADMLNFQSNGFFVEARAFDGEAESKTLFLERRLNWEGLLVEPDPINVAQIIEKNRKAWVSHSCPSTRTYPYVQSLNFVDVQCLPLYSLLLALNRTIVDYLKLSEMELLETIPFRELDINNLSVDLYKQRLSSSLLKYMKNQNYELLGTIVQPEKLSTLFMFTKPQEHPRTII